MNLESGKNSPGRGTVAGSRGSVRSNKLLYGVFLLCLGAYLGFLIATKTGSASHSIVAGTGALDESARRRVSTGPWGTLEITRIELERPDEYLPVSVPPGPPSRWFFGGVSTNQILALLSQGDLTPDQQTALADQKKWEILTNGVYITPGADVILSLSPEARGRIYGILATNGINLDQQWALRISADTVDEWFYQSGLQPATEQLLRRLLYREGNSLCFSDLEEALSQIPTDAEKRQFVKMLTRQGAVMARLRINEGQDIAPLVAYWGPQGRAKDIQPLLRAMANSPGGDSIDICELLPPFPSGLLYTFPQPTTDPVLIRRDCAWTSMNFFNDEPDPKFFDFAVTKKVLSEDYQPIQSAPAFGDIVFISRADGTPLHLAVYIADDVLFSKNGADYDEPWVLFEMKDMLAHYDNGQPLQVVTYRRKKQ